MKKMNTKSMLIAGGTLAIVGGAVAYFMKKDLRGIATFAISGLVIGAIAGNFVNVGGGKKSTEVAVKTTAPASSTAPASTPAATPAPNV